MKQFYEYTRAKIFITIYVFALTTLFVDFFGFKYWKFAIIFIPLNFFVVYHIQKKVFLKKDNFASKKDFGIFQNAKTEREKEYREMMAEKYRKGA
jgi:amino acid permease